MKLVYIIKNIPLLWDRTIHEDKWIEHKVRKDVKKGIWLLFAFGFCVAMGIPFILNMNIGISPWQKILVFLGWLAFILAVTIWKFGKVFTTPEEEIKRIVDSNPDEFDFLYLDTKYIREHALYVRDFDE